MDFIVLLWDNFVMSEITSIQVNNTTKKTPCHLQSVLSLGMLIAENLTLPRASFQASDAVWMRSALFWDFTQLRLVVYCRRFGTTVGVCAIITAVLGRVALSTGQFTFIFRANSPRRMRYVPQTSVTLHRSTGRNLRHLCENVMSHRIADRVTVYGASFTDVWRTLPHSQKPHTGHIFHSAPYDILKLWLTPISAQFYSLCILSITCRS